VEVLSEIDAVLNIFAEVNLFQFVTLVRVVYKISLKV